MTTTNKELINKRVFGVTGPGQTPDEKTAGRIGKIVDYEKEEKVYGTLEQYWVKWEDGHKEPFNPEQFKKVENFNGIGVYIK